MENNDLGLGAAETEVRNKNWIYYLAAGILLVILIILGVVFIPKISSHRFSLEFSDVSGLTEGSPLTLRGIPVGKVVEVAYAGEKAQVVVRMDPEYQDVIRTGSIFQKTEGYVAGSAQPYHIAIEIVDSDSPFVQAEMILPGSSTFVEAAVRKGELLKDKFVEDTKEVFSIGSLNVQTNITPEGGLSQRIQLQTGKYIPIELYFMGVLPSEEQTEWIREEQSAGNYQEVSLSADFDSPEEAGWANSEITITTIDRFFWEENTVQQKFYPGSFQVRLDGGQGEEDNEVFGWDELLGLVMVCIGDPTHTSCALLLQYVPELLKTAWENLSDQISKISAVPLEKVQVNISFVVPGQVLATNAVQHSGRNLVWQLTGADLNEELLLWVNYREWKPLPIILIAAVVVILVIALVFTLRRRRSTHSESDTEENENQVL